MNYDVEIAVLKEKIDALEDDFVLLYETLNKRIDDVHTINGQKIAIVSIVVAVIIGGIQIAVTFLTK